MKITADDEGLRFDKFLRRTLPQAPLNFIFQSIRKGDVKVNRKKMRQDYRLHAQDEVTFSFPINTYLATSKPHSLKQRFTIVYEDADLLVVNKPAGLASHGGTGIEDSLIAEVRTYLKDTEGRSSLAHRLDRETSGIMLVGKNKAFLRMLNAALQERTVTKTYHSLVAGQFAQKMGTLLTSLRRVQEDFTTKIVVDAAGKEARLSYKVLHEYPDFSHVQILLHTGRMHQIRVQLAEVKHPILGDKIYGNISFNKKLKTQRLYLHAFQVQFTHPRTGKFMKFTAPLPDAFTQFMKKYS
ncbi:MAG: RluA family pseudouridine synthase [Nanoarchaeota archaeon]